MSPFIIKKYLHGLSELGTAAVMTSNMSDGEQLRMGEALDQPAARSLKSTDTHQPQGGVLQEEDPVRHRRNLCTTQQRRYNTTGGTCVRHRDWRLN